MAFQLRTRAQIRQSIGLLTGKLWQDNGVTSSPTETAPSAGILIDDNLAFGTEDEHRGKWIWYTDSAAAVNQRRIIASDPSARSLIPSVGFGAVPNSSWTYELWDHDASPTQVHEFIDQSITETDRKGAVPLTSDSFHTGGNIYSWGLSSAIAGVRFAQWRRSYTGQQVTSLDNAMTAGANATVSTDSEDVKEGSNINVINVTAAASSTETIATDSHTSINMRGYTNVEFWLKSNVNTTSSNFRFQLNEGSTNRETLTLPALTADSWTRVNVALANPELDSAISRFVLQTGSSDGGSATLFADDVIVYRDNAEEWVTIPRNKWSVDQNRREFSIDRDAGVPYAKLQLVGVQLPSLLDTDTEQSLVDPQYVVHSATAKIFRMIGDEVKASMYEGMAQQQRVRMNTPSGIKWVRNA